LTNLQTGGESPDAEAETSGTLANTADASETGLPIRTLNSSLASENKSTRVTGATPEELSKLSVEPHYQLADKLEGLPKNPRQISQPSGAFPSPHSRAILVSKLPQVLGVSFLVGVLPMPNMKIPMLLVVTGLASTLFFSGCVQDSSAMNRLSIGMTKQQVIQVMGQPATTMAFSREDPKEVLVYPLSNRATGVVSYYDVVLRQGRVTGYLPESTTESTVNLNVKNR
jgi:hypothetical protein